MNKTFQLKPKMNKFGFATDGFKNVMQTIQDDDLQGFDSMSKNSSRLGFTAKLPANAEVSGGFYRDVLV